MSGRPLVILGGWLGSQPKHLRRYEKLYEKLGFDVISFIPDPRLVVDAALNSHRTVVPLEWPVNPSLQERPTRMQQLAWQVLAQVHRKQSFFFLFHAFSNGGCFLWEGIRRVLDCHKNDSCPQPTRDILKDLAGRIKGVVFDSCPCWFGAGSSGSLRAAMQYCSTAEKLEILKEYGPGVALYDGEDEAHRQIKRSSDFFGFLYQDELDIPQLYLCSKDDPLCNFEKVKELVNYRRSEQKSQIFFQGWDKSMHCGHLRMNPVAYKEVVEIFTVMTLLKSKL
jgi:hypothetical protein